MENSRITDALDYVYKTKDELSLIFKNGTDGIVLDNNIITVSSMKKVVIDDNSKWFRGRVFRVLDLTNIDFSKISVIDHLFKNVVIIDKFILGSKKELSNCTSAIGAFENFKALELDLGNMEFIVKGINIESMFSNIQVDQLYLPIFNGIDLGYNLFTNNKDHLPKELSLRNIITNNQNDIGKQIKDELTLTYKRLLHHYLKQGLIEVDEECTIEDGIEQLLQLELSELHIVKNKSALRNELI